MKKIQDKVIKAAITIVMLAALSLQSANIVLASEQLDIETLQKETDLETSEKQEDPEGQQAEDGGEDSEGELPEEDESNGEKQPSNGGLVDEGEKDSEEPTDNEEKDPEELIDDEEKDSEELTDDEEEDSEEPDDDEEGDPEELPDEEQILEETLEGVDGQLPEEDTEIPDSAIDKGAEITEEPYQEIMLMQQEYETMDMKSRQRSESLKRIEISEGIYTISSSLDERYRVTVADNSMKNGANIQLSKSADTDAQKFYIHHLGGKSYVIISLTSGKVVEVENGQSQDGTNICQNSYDNLPAQKWWISCDNEGYYTFVSEATGKVLDVTGGNAGEGSNLQQYTWNESDAQHFILNKCEEQILTEGEYVLQTALADNMVLDINGAGSGNGANVQIYEMNGSSAQTFQVKYNEDGTYTFVAKHSGKVLDVSGGSYKNGANVQQYQENGSAAQRWLLKDTGNGYYMLFSAASGKTLDVESGSDNNGTNVQVYEANGSLAQKISFQAAPAKVAEGIYTIVSGLNSSKVVDIVNAEYRNGANVQLYSSNGTDAQKFYFHDIGNRNYIAISCSSGKVLEVQNESTFDGANICQNTYRGSVYQKWILRNKGDGYYELVSVGTGKVLDVSGGNDKDGTNIQQYKSNGSKAQKFLLRSESKKNISEDTFSLRPIISANKVLDISGGSAQNGANVQIYEINGSKAQNFQMKYNGDGTYTLLAAHSSKALDVSGNGWHNGTNVQQYENNGSAAQKWLIHNVGDGKYIFISASNGKVLDISDGRDFNGTNVQIYEYNGLGSQQFIIQKNRVDVSDGIYSIHTELNHNQVLDISGGSIAEGANVQLYSYNGTDAQKFYIHRIDEKNYILISLASGRVLTVENNGWRDGENVSLSSYRNSNYQKWWLVQNENGSYSFISAATGKALDVAAGSSQNGSNIQQYTINGSAAQKFVLKNISQKAVAEAAYVLRSKLASNKALDVAGASDKDGANVQLYQNNGTMAQQFQLKFNNDGTYTLLAGHSKKALDISGDNYHNGANVQQYRQNGSAAQKWLLKDVGGGYYVLFSASNGKALDISGANTANGTNVQIYEYNGSNAQKFYLDDSGIANISGQRLISCDGSEFSGKKMKITLKTEKNDSIKNLNYDFYIVLMDSAGNKVLEAQKANVKLNGGLVANAFFSSSDSFKTLVMGQFALAVRTVNGYELISDSKFLSNPEIIKLTDDDIKDRYYGYYEGYKITSKKGIQGVSYAYTEDLGVQHVLLNVDLADMISTVPRNGYISFAYKGRTYYFQDLIALKKTVYDLHGWGSTEGNAYGLNHMRSVTFNLLLSWDDNLSYLIHPLARVKGAAPYYALNMKEENARNTFEALFCYLGEEFGTDYKERVSNWTLGNEVNSCDAWNYSGGMSLKDCVENYAQAFQLLSQGVHRAAGSSRVFISLDHCWNAADAGYGGKEFLDEFASYMSRTAPSMQWNVNYHPYSQPLNRNDFWNDRSNTTDSLNTKYISMRNIQVLTDYLGTLESIYGKQNGSIRVILGELGYSANNQNDEKVQAAALGYGYYKAMFNTRVDAYIIRAYLDDPTETRNGLYLGLRNNDAAQTAKESYDVYKNLDTENSLSYMDPYLGIIGIRSWQDVISGFDASKLPAQDF